VRLLPPCYLYILETVVYAECGLAATLAESLGLSGHVQDFRGYAAAEAEPGNFDTDSRKAKAFRNDSGQAASFKTFSKEFQLSLKTPTTVVRSMTRPDD
jgi:hypothetical protein